MGGTVSSRAITSIVTAVISLGLMAWALFLIDYGWDLRQSGSELMREWAFTFLAGGVLLFVAALAGIIHAGIKLRRLARRCQSSGPCAARVVNQESVKLAGRIERVGDCAG